MRSTDIIDALGNVGDDLVASAEERRRKNASLARKIAILAAAVCVIAVSVMIPLFSALNNSDNKDNTVLNSDGRETETDETKGNNGNLSYTVLTSDSQGDATGKMLSTRVVSASVNSRVEADKMFDIYVGASDVHPNRDNVRFVLNIRAGDKERPLFPYNLNLEDKKVINAFSFEGVNGEYEEILYDRGVINTSSKVVFEMTSGGIPSKNMSAIRVAPVDIEKYPIGSIYITFASFRLDDQGEVIKDKYSYGCVGTTLYYAVSDGIIGFSFQSVEDALNNARSCETKSMYDDPFARTRDNSRYSECCPVEPTNTSISGIGYEIDEPISLEFGIIDGMIADKYQVVVNGDYSSVNIDNSVIPSTNENKHFTVSFVPKPNEDGRMVIRINVFAYLNGECVNPNAVPIRVYMAVHDNKVYLSYESSECALLEAGIPVEFDFITLEKTDKDEDQVKGAKVPIIPLKFNVSGTINWTDAENNTHPAQYVYVVIHNSYGMMKGSLLGSTTTDDEGFFSVNVAAPRNEIFDVYIKVYAKGSNVTVVNNSDVGYSYMSPTSYGVSAGDRITKDVTFTKGSNMGKAMSVQQGIALASRYIKTLENQYLPNIDVCFPKSGNSTYYHSGEGKIYIIDGDAFDWDVLEHEYGHYVQNCYNIGGMGGNHILVNLEDWRDQNGHYVYEKNHAIQLAWGEGWATYFAIHLQKAMNASSMNIPNVGDDIYTDTNDNIINIDIERAFDSENNWYCLLGEACEITVASILLDLTDSIDLDDYDTVCFSPVAIWELIKDNNCHTLSDLISAIYNNSEFLIVDKMNLGLILTYFGVSPYLRTEVVFSGNTPTFSWIAQGGSLRYPNNLFRLSFYDPSMNLILSTQPTTNTYLTLSESQWNQILNASGTAYLCCVEAYQTAYPATGVYLSCLIGMDKPN